MTPPRRSPRGQRPAVPGLKASLVALAAAAPLLSAFAAGPAAKPDLTSQVQALIERVQQLEQRNRDLEQRVQALRTAPPAAAAPAPIAPALAAASETRLRQVEREHKELQDQVQALGKGHEDEHKDGEPEGLKVEGGVLAIGQRVNGRGSADGRSQGRLNYRGDILLSLPGPSVGQAQGTAVGQLRFGQGGGLALRPTHTGTVNSTAFDPGAGADEAYAIVAQAYYQLAWPLDAGRFNDSAGNRVELTVGKLDLFGFFDQNAVAGDEASQFLNNVFVHNPLLDSGGDIAADRYGFAPGARLGYFAEGESLAWGVSVGVFGAGSGANFSGSPGRPLTIAQLEVSPRQINGEARATYRLYAWTNGRTADLDGNEQRHTGFGLSADQRIGRDWNLFGRIGRRTRGTGTFDDAATFGFEHGGRAWGRSKDALGVAVGWLKTGSAWRTATADGTLAGYAASGAERIVEVYYRIKLAENLDLTPDFQLIQRPGGDGAASTVRVLGLRARVGF